MTDYERFGNYEIPEEHGNFGTALMFLFIGLGIGAVTALLFAPKSGKQIRKTLRRKYEDARDVMDDWTDQAGGVLDKGKDWAGKAKDRGSDWASKAKDRVSPIADRIRR